MQQFTLALNVAENIMFLQRPYFVSALNENPQDPTKSMYGHSYLVVVERCNVGHRYSLASVWCGSQRRLLY